eukprot:SRR837773.13031.p4 GENE.SRR837773.13031~~SRR837773.13031.p4  ORF type:complete len:103 (+),score=13.73 SRR837773.13031:498-806(+)
MWGYIGCLVAGFGVYGLIGPCVGMASEAVFAARYKEIGDVIVAIFMQVLVFTALTRKSARELLVSRMRRLCNALLCGIEAIVEQDLVKLNDAARMLEDTLLR